MTIVVRHLILAAFLVAAGGALQADELSDLRAEVKRLRDENGALRAQLVKAPATQATRMATGAGTRPAKRMSWFLVSWKDGGGQDQQRWIQAEFKLAAMNEAKDLGAKNPTGREATRAELAAREAETKRPGIYHKDRKIEVGMTLDEAIRILGAIESREKNTGGSTVTWRGYEDIIVGGGGGGFNPAAASAGRKARVLSQQVEAEFDAQDICTSVRDSR